MNPCKNKLNDVGVDNHYLPGDLNRRRILFLLLNLIVFVPVIVSLFLVEIHIDPDRPYGYSTLGTVTVVILAYRLLGLLLYHYDPDGKQSEMTAKERKHMLRFYTCVYLVLFTVHGTEGISMFRVGVFAFCLLLNLCLDFCENVFYFKHLIRFYQEIEEEHGSTDS